RGRPAWRAARSRRRLLGGAHRGRGRLPPAARGRLGAGGASRQRGEQRAAGHGPANTGTPPLLPHLGVTPRHDRKRYLSRALPVRRHLQFPDRNVRRGVQTGRMAGKGAEPGSGGPVSSGAALNGFSTATRAWFEGAFAVPTQAQAQAWRAIGKGEDTLVIAPTGSGKTLAAFLWAIDRLASVPAPADRKRRTRVLYVSPLKALAVDIERNLRSPLIGIRQAAQRLGLPEPDIQVAVRTGDTAAEDRRKLVTRPPDILITTPESLFLLLTSQARETLRGVETVIVDDIHAVAGTKRGAHLALSLERLDALRGATSTSASEAGASGAGASGAGPARAQRVGLSATVRPPSEVASFLGGARPVTV